MELLNTLSALFIIYGLIIGITVIVDTIYFNIYKSINKVIKYKRYYLYLFLFFIIIFFSKIIYDISFLDTDKYCEKETISNYGYIETTKLVLVNYYDNFKDKILHNDLIFLLILFGSFIIPTLSSYLLFKNNRIRFFITFIYIHLLAILIPVNGFTPSQDRMKISSVKANMHTFQTMLETYSVDWNGEYPKNIDQLKREAIKNNYWKSLKNPYTDGITKFELVNDFKKLQSFEIECKKFDKNTTNAGLIIYNPIIEDKNIYKYYLYGLSQSKDSLFLIKDKNEYFTLSND